MSERIAKRISASRLFPQFGREFLAELTHLGRDDVRAARLARVGAEIIPMVVLVRAGRCSDVGRNQIRSASGGRRGETRATLRGPGGFKRDHNHGKAPEVQSR